jgi:hypothetical protein
MQTDRNQKIVIVIYVLVLVGLFSYLPMVKTFRCGCAFMTQGWIWEKPALLYDMHAGPDKKPVPTTWSVDWRRLAPRLVGVSIIAFLAFFMMGGTENGWWMKITNMLNALAALSLAGALGLIAAVMIYAKVHGCLPEGTWGEWPGNHGPWHRTFLLSFIGPDSPVIYFKRGLLAAIQLVTSSIISSFLAMHIRFSLFTFAVFGCGIITFYLYFKYLYWLID